MDCKYVCMWTVTFFEVYINVFFVKLFAQKSALEKSALQELSIIINFY